MIKHNQDGAVSGAVVSLVLAVLLLIGAVVFGSWAFSSRQNYKNNTDAISAAAVKAAVTQEDKTKDASFAEQQKNPLKTYNGPEAYGSLVIQFPKTWSGYVDDTGQGSDALVDGYFAPGVVPSITDPNSVFALRVQVLNQTYAQTIQNFDSQQQQGTITVAAYSLPKLPNVVGVEVSGQLVDNQPSTTMVVLPLRSDTLEIYTQGNQFISDFNKNILPNFSFSP